MPTGTVSNDTTELDLVVQYDADVARMDFEDCFHLYSHSGYRSTCRVFYTGWDENDYPETVTECFDYSEVTRRETRQFVIDTLRDGEWFTVRDIIQECRDAYDGNWFDYAMDVLNDEYKFELSDVFDDERRPTLGEFKYDVVSVTGYSQGDYAEVLFDASKWDGDSSAARKHFERLFYDQPVYARLIVDDEEYYLDELMEDNYDYDRDKLRAAIEEKWSDKLDINVRNWVYINLPEHPEYV